jgi:S1-C subfamily serine protease
MQHQPRQLCGALLNTSGEVIGINTLRPSTPATDSYGNTISADGIGFAIPINEAKAIAEKLIAKGKIDRPASASWAVTYTRCGDQIQRAARHPGQFRHRCGAAAQAGMQVK